ncbi:MAG TPA: beta-N-acetylglucosaminidase domain-containing protein, partial [Blastocatellia bacterium]
AWLRRLKLLDKLIAYASSAPGADSAGAIVRAVTQASAFLNAIKFMRDDVDRVLRFDRAQFELLFSRYLTDWAYALTIRPALDDYVKGELKAAPDSLGDASERAEAFAFERVKQIAEELFKEQFRRNIHAILLSGGERAQLQISMMQRLQVRLPTKKTSEAEIRQSIYIPQINLSEVSPIEGRARWFLENEDVDERIEKRFLSIDWSRFKSDVAEVDIVIKLSSQKGRSESPESYAISSSRKGETRRVTITAPSNHGVFYALSKLEALGAEGRLAENFQISESPAIARRGVAEAFRGSPWSQGDRLETLRFLGLARMNRYVYAPKDDDWRLDYSEQDLEKFRQLARVSEENFVRFVYAVRPGALMTYSGDEDAAAIIRKLEAMAALGLNSFAICFDDAPASLQNDADLARFKTPASAHAHLINLAYDRLKRSGGDFELYVAPAVSAGDYMKELSAAIPQDVLLFPWDDFAANDDEPSRAPICAKRGGGLTTGQEANGFIAIAAREPRASMLPIATAADYAWDWRNYNQQQAFDRALNLLYDERARAAMRVWARAHEDDAFKQRMAELRSATETIGVTLNQGLLRGELIRFIEKMK